MSKPDTACGAYPTAGQDARSTVSRKVSKFEPSRVVMISIDRAANAAIEPPGSASATRKARNSSVPSASKQTEDDVSAIRQELRRILDSRTFSRAVQLRNLLKWIIDHWLAGEDDQLDGYHILRAVVPKSDSAALRFDPSGRVYVGRLRSQLEKYYSNEGSLSQVRLVIPKGRYIPVAYLCSGASEGNTFADVSSLSIVMVLPFQHSGLPLLTPCPPPPPAIADYIIWLLTQTSGVRVVARMSSSQEVAPPNSQLLREKFGVQFLLEGVVNQTAEGWECLVYLSETENGYNVWSGCYKGAPTRLVEIARQIVRDTTPKMRKAPFITPNAPIRHDGRSLNARLIAADCDL